MSNFKRALPLMLILSMVFAGVAAWLVWGFHAGTAPALVPEAGNAESRVAKAPQKSAENTGTGVAAEPSAPDGDDPKAIVVAVGPEGLVGWDLQVRADGTMMTRQVRPEVKTFSLSLVAGEVRGLLDYIVQEKLFFEMHEDHVDHKGLKRAQEHAAFKDMMEEDARDRYTPKVLQVHARGRTHEVRYRGLNEMPATPERERLKAILARIGTFKAQAMAAPVKLPDDPRAVVLAMGSALPNGEMVQTSFQIRADGSMGDVAKGSPEFFLSARELQDLLCYIIREKQFFAMAKNHVHIDPKTAHLRGPYLVNVLRMQADGRQHEVIYLLEVPLPTPEVENLKAILARIESVKATARASRLTLPADPQTPVIRFRYRKNQTLEIRANGRFIAPDFEGMLSENELQQLLHYIVRENNFFTIEGDQWPFEAEDIPELRVRADGKDHTVTSLLHSGLLCFGTPSDDDKRLGKIFTRIRDTRALVQANAQAVKLPADPQTPVIRIQYPKNRALEIRANGRVNAPDFEGTLSKGELQQLLHYIVREKNFFTIKQDQRYLPPQFPDDPAACLGIEELCVQAGGKDHTVTKIYGFAANPATEEGTRLNDVLAGIEKARASARAKAPAAAPQPGDESKPAKPQAQEETTPVWTVLDPHQWKATAGTKLTKLADKSILASGPNPTPETYAIVAHTTLPGITAIRLEVLLDPSLPRNGPGRWHNGNFTLNAFRVQAAPKNDPVKAQAIVFKAATADFSQENFGIQTVLDGNTRATGGWAVDPQEGRKHVAVFELKAPLGHEEGTTLTFALVQDHIGPEQHNIGRFRLSVTNIKPPFPFELSSVTAEDMAAFWAELGSADAKRATQAAENLFRSGRAVSFLKTQLKPEVVKVDAKQVARWLEELDDNVLEVRENATRQLEKVGSLAAAALMRSIARARSLEAHRRVERLLEKLKDSPEVVRPQRAVELLVRVGSLEARELLASLAKGPPDAVLTQAALAAPAADQ